jgi:hypothetical protein
MTYKQHTLTNKPVTHVGTFGFSTAGVVAKLLNIVRFELAVGYQDEGGFHYGVKSAEKDTKWPSVW